MSYVQAKDISKYQGNWQDTGEQIVSIKVGGGDDGLYFDPDCTQNYNGAKADGRSTGLYWFAGGTNVSAEAAFFCRGMQPYEDGDVPELDIESGKTWNPSTDPNAVNWVMQFVDYVEAQGFTGGLIYMNLATLLAHDWSPVLARWGLWLADWSVSPNANIPTHYTYVMQQYSDGPNYDHDVWFGTLDQFKAYGYHAPQPTPPVVEPEPVTFPPAPDPTPPVPVTTPTEPASEDETTPEEPTKTTPAPQQPPIPVQEVTPPKATVVTVSSPNLWLRIWIALLKIFGGK